MLFLVLAACADAPDGNTALRIGNHAEPTSLDPHRSEDVPARNIQRDLFEGLMTVDAAGHVVGALAEDWQLSDDATEWTFRLRGDARWSNGDPVTADDLVFSFRRAVTPETGGIVSETLLPIRNATAIMRGNQPPETLGAVAIDARTLRLELESPTAYFLSVLTHPSTFPVHPPTVKAAGERWARPGTLVSNGAYQLKEWVVHSHIALEKNPHYHDAKNVAITRVEYLPIEDQRAELARFEAGDIHLTYGVPPGRMNWLREHFDDALRVHPWFGVYYLGINTRKAPLEDSRVRHALAMVIDRERIANDVVGTGETPVYGWIPEVHGYAGNAPEWADWPMQQRVDQAREWLREANFDTGAPISLLYNTRDRDQRVVTAVAAMWREQLGVETRLVNQEWKVYLQTRRQQEHTQVFRSGWIGNYPDPNSFAEILHASHGMNDFGWHNARHDALLEQAAATLDPQQRFALLAEAERIVMDEMPLIPLFRYATARLVSPRLEGYSENVMNHQFSKHFRWRDPD